MTTAIRKIGNSAGVILSKPALAALGVSEGGVVDIISEPGRLTIVPAARKPVREGWEEDFRALAAEGLSEEDREWLDADLSPLPDDPWDAVSEEDMRRVEAELLADGVVKP